ncbi:hypothetical protein FDECE_15394 [Fusarium decemcellulare]|nr:hypothetical protein FDECE_15394 [Fusarium decemcellulare]
MYFQDSLKVALVALFCQSVLGTPVALKSSNPLAARATAPMTRADAFSNSGTDYETWAKRMVDEGKMWYPEKRSMEVHNAKAEMKTIVVRHADGTSSLERRATKLKLNNIVCEGLGGKKELYDEGKNKFCGVVRASLVGVARGFEFAIQRGLCRGGESCDFYVSLGVTAWTALAQIQRDEECGPMFDQVREACAGYSGAAQIIVPGNPLDYCGPPTCTDSGVATKVGYFEAQFFEADSGWQCPAPSQELICKKELF